MPARGSCNFLEKTLDSINLSSKLPSRLILINDGIDHAIADKILSKNKKYGFEIALTSNRGKGLVDALNTGLQESKSEFLARIDNDDLANPMRFEEQVKLLKSDKEVGVVGSQVNYIDSQGIKLGVSNYPSGLVRAKDLITGCCIAHPAVMYRRRAVIESGSYRKVIGRSGIDLAEDYDLWMRIIRNYKIINMIEPLTSYRQHNNQLSMLNLSFQQTSAIFIRALHSNGNELVSEANLERAHIDLGVNLDKKYTIDLVRSRLGIRQSFRTWLLISTSYLNPVSPKFKILRILIKILSIVD